MTHWAQRVAERFTPTPMSFREWSDGQGAVELRGLIAQAKARVLGVPVPTPEQRYAAYVEACTSGTGELELTRLVEDARARNAEELVRLRQAVDEAAEAERQRQERQTAEKTSPNVEVEPGAATDLPSHRQFRTAKRRSPVLRIVYPE